MTVALTFLFTDIADSTTLWEQAPQAMRGALARHDAILRTAVENHNGRTVKTTGDGLHAVFKSARDGVQAAVAGQQALAAEEWPAKTGPIRVRMGLHSGESQERAGDFYGSTVNAAARIMALGHGGQILLSELTAVMVRGQNPGTISFANLGPHALKGFSHPEVIFQLLHPDLIKEFPPLKSVSVPKHNLPAQLTPLVGREGELTSLIEMVADPDHTLVCIVGPGGMGKSRLALATASRSQTFFPDGVWFVPLSSIDNSANISTAIAKALGLSFAGPLDPQQQLVRQLQDRQMLLILDNFEQLLPLGADVISLLTHNLPHLTLLVTSRERLLLQAETPFAISGLPLESARALFVDRARSAGADLSLDEDIDSMTAVDDISRLVGGLPLAIELAAAWTRLLHPAEILTDLKQNLDLLSGELHDIPKRHRSVQVVFDTSWSRLPHDVQNLLAGLSVFAGSFTRDAASSTCDATLMQLATLLDHSLIQRDDDRFRLHELIRQFAAKKLADKPEMQTAVHSRHAAYYAELLADISDYMKTGQPHLTGWERTIDTEMDNIQVAWQWTIENRQPQLFLAGMLAFFNYLDLRGQVQDGVQMTAALGECAALVRTENPADADRLARTEAMALLGQATLGGRSGQFARSRELGQKALSLLKGREAPVERVMSISLIGPLAMMATNQDEGRRHIDELIVLAKRHGHTWGYGLSLNFLGLFHISHKQPARAKDLLIDAVALWSKHPGFAWCKERSMIHLGLVHHALGDYSGAQAIQQEALRLAQEVQDHSFVPLAECNLAFHHYAQGHLDQAKFGFLSALAEARRFNLFNSVGHSLLGLGLVAAVEGLPARAATLLTFGARQPGGYKAFLLGEPQRVLAGLRKELAPADFAAAEEQAQNMKLANLLANPISPPFRDPG